MEDDKTKKNVQFILYHIHNRLESKRLKHARQLNLCNKCFLKIINRIYVKYHYADHCKGRKV